MLGYRTAAPADPGKVPSFPQHPQNRASLPPPRSQLLFKGAFLGTLLQERAPGRKRWELLPSRCQQTWGTFCNLSKIRCTSQPVRSCTQHSTGSRARLRDPELFPSAGGSHSQGKGCLTLRNPAQWENVDRERVLCANTPTSHTDRDPPPHRVHQQLHGQAQTPQVFTGRTSSSRGQGELDLSMAELGICRNTESVSVHHCPEMMTNPFPALLLPTSAKEKLLREISLISQPK